MTAGATWGSGPERDSDLFLQGKVERLGRVDVPGAGACAGGIAAAGGTVAEEVPGAGGETGARGGGEEETGGKAPGCAGTGAGSGGSGAWSGKLAEGGCLWASEPAAAKSRAVAPGTLTTQRIMIYF